MKAELARRDIPPSRLADHLGISERTFRRRLNGQGKAFDCDEIDAAGEFFDISPLAFVVPSAVRVDDLHVMARDIHIYESRV